jgi:signal transduction histidine kinase
MPRVLSLRKSWLIPATLVSACLIALPWFVHFGPVNGATSGIAAAVLMTFFPAYLLLQAALCPHVEPRLRQAAGLIGTSIALVCAGNLVRVLSALGVPFPNIPGIDLVSNVVIGVINFAGLVRFPLMPTNRGTFWRLVTDVAIAGVGMALIIAVISTYPGLKNGPPELRGEVMVFNIMAIANLLMLTVITVRGSLPHLSSAIRWLSLIIVLDTLYLVVFEYIVGTRSHDVRFINSLFFAEYLAYLYFAACIAPAPDEKPASTEARPLLWAVNPLPLCAVLGVGVLLVISAFGNTYAVVPLSIGLVVMSVLMLTRVVLSNLEIIRNVNERNERESRIQTEKLALTRRLSGGIAHIINSMMTVIHGHAELLRAETPPESLGAGSLEAISSSAYRVSALAGRLELASGTRGNDESRTRLVEAVLLQRDYVNRMVGQKREVVWDLSRDSGNALIAPSDMETIMRELISNAGEATFQGGKITIRIREDAHSPLPSGISPIPAEGLYSVLEVADTGRGIPEDELPHVTEPFFTSRPQPEGRGLGLSIVHGIVASYGGGLLIDTVPGSGSRVRVYLPAVA